MDSRLLLWASLALLAACSTGEKLDDRPTPSAEAVGIDAGAGGVIFPADRGYQVGWLGLGQGLTFWTPAPSDVALLERDLRSELERGLVEPARLDDYVLEHPEYAPWIRNEVGHVLERLDDYRRQYVGLITEEGQRRVLVRCFPGPAFGDSFEFEDWQENLAVVSDGGFWYWYAVYDLESGRLVQFHSNGYA